LVQHSLGDVAVVERDPVTATAFYLEALESSTEASYSVYCLGGLAAVAALDGDAPRAGRLWGAVESYEQTLGESLFAPTLSRYEAALRGVAGPVFAAAKEEGHMLTLQDAVQHATQAFSTVAKDPFPAD
jgi:hypothetical protein